MTTRRVSSERPSKIFPPGSPPDHVIRAQHLAERLEKEEVNLVPVTKQVSVSLPLESLAEIEALARRLDVSRGSMIWQLTDLGIGVLFEQFSKAALAEVREEVARRYAELVKEAGGEYTSPSLNEGE